MMIFPGILALYQMFFFLKFVKYDSPTHYLKKDDIANYKLVLSQIFDEQSIKTEIERYESPEKSALTMKKAATVKSTCTELLFDKRFRKQTRIGIILGIIQQLSGSNAIIFYSSTIFQSIGSSIFISRLMTFFLGLTMMVSCAFTILLMRIFGRKSLLISGFIILSIDLMTIGLVVLYIPEQHILTTILICAFMFVFFYALSSTLFAYFGETLNEQALSIATSFNFLSNIIVVLAFPYAVINVGLAATFFFFSICMIIGAIYCIIDVSETQYKTRDEIMETKA